MVTYALVVNDLDDGRQSAGVGAVALDEDDTADLDLSPFGRFDNCVAHCDGVLEAAVRRKEKLQDRKRAKRATRRCCGVVLYGEEMTY